MFMAKSPQKLFRQKAYDFNGLADSLQHPSLVQCPYFFQQAVDFIYLFYWLSALLLCHSHNIPGNRHYCHSRIGRYL